MSEAVEQTQATPAPEAPTMDLIAAAKDVWGEDVPAADAGSTPEAPGPEKPETAPEAEPAAEAKPEETPAVDDKVSKKIAAAARAERAAAQARQELRTAQEKLATERAALDAEKARFRVLEENPEKAFEVLGLDPKTFLEKLAGEHKPENVAERQLKALQAELAELKAGIARREEAATQQVQRAQVDQTVQSANAIFVQHITEGAEKYPNLVAEFTEAEAVQEAHRALSEVVGEDEDGKPITRNQAYFNQFGIYPDNDVIAEHLDAVAKQRAEARQNSAWAKRGQSPTNGSQPLSNGDPNPKAQPVNKGSSPRTLTSRAASEKASPPKQWSQEAADEESLRILQGAFRD